MRKVNPTKFKHAITSVAQHQNDLKTVILISIQAC